MTTLRYAIDKIHTKAPSFCLPSAEGERHNLSTLMGEVGLLLAFSGDIWDIHSIRQVMWLQRYAPQFALLGARSALVAPNDSDALRSFVMSNPLKIPFKLLADPQRQSYHAYNIKAPCLLFISRSGYIGGQWHLGGTGAISVAQDVLHTIQARL